MSKTLRNHPAVAEYTSGPAIGVDDYKHAVFLKEGWKFQRGRTAGHSPHHTTPQGITMDILSRVLLTIAAVALASIMLGLTAIAFTVDVSAPAPSTGCMTDSECEGVADRSVF